MKNMMKDVILEILKERTNHETAEGKTLIYFRHPADNADEFLERIAEDMVNEIHERLINL